MSLVVFQDVSLSLGGKSIVDALDLRIGDRERIGLVGPNGSGKSTILRLIAGEQIPDGGQIHRPRGLRIGYLPQDVAVEGGRPLLTFVRESVPGRAELDRSLEAALAELEAAEKAGGEADPDHAERMLELAGRVAELHEEIAHFDAHYSEFEAKGILAGLGFKAADLDRDLGELSGGWKMRAVLAALLFQRPDLLLLDEPTNHLDMPSVAWFSSFLRRYDRTFVLISHDREFLNEQIRRVVSLEAEGVRSYQGDYESYRRQREEERVLLENRVKNLEREREHLEQFIRRFRAKATKAAQVQSRVRQLEKMDAVELHQDRAVMSFRFPPTERAGKDVLVVDGLAKCYGDRKVLSDVTLRVDRGDRIALLGVNGAGKTTLLRILAGEIAPSGGAFTFGHNTKVGYYAQHHAESLDASRTVYDEVARCCRDGGHQRIRAVLGAMLFGDLEIEKKVGVLSGGERARVALSQLLVDPGNVLLMDEPTNHLDLDSSERLAEALGTFDGTLLFVSHNRAFIRALATKIWFVDGGKVEVYPGSFDDYIASCQLRDAAPAAAVIPADATNRAPGSPSPGSEPAKRASREDDKARKRDEARHRTERNKKLRPLERRVAELEARIATLEEAQRKRTEELGDPAVYQDAARRDALMQAFAREKAELEVATDTWMEVQEELEALKATLGE